MALRAILFAVSSVLVLGSAVTKGRPLSDAIAEGDVKKVEQLLAKGADPNKIDKDGVLPLYQAVTLGNKEIVSLLLKAKAKVAARTDAYAGPSGTAFQAAAATGELEMAKLLVSRGAKIDVSADAIVRAASGGNIEFVKYLEERGANLRAKGAQGEQPIHRGADNTEMLRYLLSRSADPVAKENTGTQPIHIAARAQNLTAVILLVEAGADVNAPISSPTDYFLNGRRPLDLAVDAALSSGKPETAYKDLAVFLIGKGADVNAQDADGSTALHFASGESVVTLLLDHGAKMDTADKWGNQPIHRAASRNDIAALSVLLARGAALTPQNSEGRTPLDAAAFNGRQDAMKLLLEKGTKPTELTLISALSAGKTDSLPLLLQHGAKITAKVYLESYRVQDQLFPLLNREVVQEISGTILPEAVEKGDLTLVKKLIDAGALVDVPYPTEGCCADESMRGVQAIHYAAELETPEILNLLLEKGAKADASTEAGLRPLHIAAAAGRIVIVERLLAAGADPSLKGPDGKTAAELAVKNGHKAVSKLLVPPTEKQ